MPAAMAGNDARVSVLTCSPGDEAYSLFGHTALRYASEQRNVDVVFNYGYFDFDSPNFAWRFVLGETDYMVGCVGFRQFLSEYAARGSAVVEQVLNLTDEQKEWLFAVLVENCSPENRVYRYNYFYNNCTTKVRDKILEVLGISDFVYGDTVTENCFRNELGRFTGQHPWYAFGIDLILGPGVDEPASRAALQFIPGNFSNDLDKAFVTGDSGMVPVVAERSVLLEEKKDAAAAKSHFTPMNVSLLLLVATFVVMLCELRKKKSYWWYDVLLMLVQGVAGLLILFMVLFSQHPAVDANYLLLLLNPLALAIMPLLVLRIRKKRSLKIAWLQVAFVALFLLSAIFGLQSYPVPIFFCAIALLVRSLFHIYRERICELDMF